MYRDQFGEFVCGYWGLKGYYSLAFCSSKQVAFLKEQFFTCWYSNKPTFASDLLHHLKLLHQKENWIYPEKKTMQQINTNLCMAKINHLAVMNTSKENKLKSGHQNLTNN